MKVRSVFSIAAVAMALLVSVPLHPSKAADPPAASSIDLADPAFARYVDLNLLGQAWEQLDASLLTDCALQLAEGERILMRSHKAITAQQVLELATKIAAEKNDKSTLDRLANVAAATKNTAAAEQIAAAKKLAGVSRKVEAAPTVPATDTNPDQLALYQEAINGAKAATVAADVSYFDNLEAALNDKECILVRLSDTQRKYLTKLISDTRPLLSKTADPKLGATLLKLKEVSRESPFYPEERNSFPGSFGGGFGTFGQGTNVFGNPIPQYQQPPYQTMNPPQFQQPQAPPYQYSPGPTYQQQQPYYYQQQRSYYPPRPSYPPGYGSRPPCYSPSTFGRHGWCGNG